MSKKNRTPAPTPAKPTVKPTPVKARGRIEFPLVGDKNEDVYPFKVPVPEGFDFKAHKALKKRDFEADHMFYSFRAAELEFKALAFHAQAEEAKKLGSAQDRGRAKRLIKCQSKMDELRQQLTAQGVDVDKLLADAAKEADEAAA